MKIKKIFKILILTLLMLFVINESHALTPSISVGTSGLNNFSNQGASTTQTPIDSTSRIIMTLSGAKGKSRKGNLFTNDVLENIDQYKPNDIDSKSAKKIETAAGTILKTITNIGVVLSVVILAVLGIKYMIGSVEEKAEYKKDLVPYVIGGFMLFGISTIMKIIIGIGTSINNI